MNFSNEITERERQVLILICQEKTAKEIGAELGLSKRWIEGVKYDLARKTGAKSIVGLAIHAIKNEIFQL